jgi:hypothetical protein
MPSSDVTVTRAISAVVAASVSAMRRSKVGHRTLRLGKRGQQRCLKSQQQDYQQA